MLEISAFGRRKGYTNNVTFTADIARDLHAWLPLHARALRPLCRHVVLNQNFNEQLDDAHETVAVIDTYVIH